MKRSLGKTVQVTSHAKACSPRLLSRGHEGGALDMQVFPEVKQVLAEFKSKYNLSKLGAQGFCWGGKYTVLLLGMAQSCHHGPAGASQNCILTPCVRQRAAQSIPVTYLGRRVNMGPGPLRIDHHIEWACGIPIQAQCMLACLSFRSRCKCRELEAKQGCL